jgi:type IV pilus assembly protein PilW
MMFLNNKIIFSQKGFSLVELMVGLVIGLLATLIISQTMGVFQGQQRSTTGTADAQTNGGIALYSISRELKMAGYPLLPTGQASVPDSALDCTTTNLNTAVSGVTSINPVTITDGTSDSLTIRYGDSQNGGIPTKITSYTNTTDSTLGNYSSVRVQNGWGCNANDVVVITGNSTCDIRKMVPATTESGSVIGPVLDDNTGSYVRITSQPTGSLNDFDFSCLGSWNEVTYAVVNGNLERSVNGGAGETIVTGIVNLQAQYGIAVTANSNQITQWVNATGSTWAAPSVADRNRIKAVRIAVIAQNPQIDNNIVTTTCNQTTSTGLCAWQDLPVGGAITVASPAPSVDLTGIANWNKYRYRVFETIIPLRNMVWAKDTL